MAELLTRKGYLEEYLEKTRHYGDLILNETGVNLGNVEIKDMFFVPINFTRNLIQECLSERNYFDVILSPIASIIVTGEYLFSGGAASSLYYEPDKIIFVNTRKKIRSEVLKGDGIDRLVVHELSHKLWHELAGDSIDIDLDNPRFKMMQEGFATYCERDLFAHLYPKKGNINYADLWDQHDYLAGGLRMMRFIQKYGEEIALQVPKRWEELDKETPLVESEFISSTKEQIASYKGKILLRE